jgi:hypothetical protein
VLITSYGGFMSAIELNPVTLIKPLLKNLRLVALFSKER